MKLLVVGGFILFIGPIFLLPDSYEKWSVQKYGTLVKMKIEKLPASCIGARVRYTVIFSYKDKIFEKQTRGNFCDHHRIGELVDMKMREGSAEILFPKEPALFAVISCYMLSLFGLGCMISQFKKNRK